MEHAATMRRMYELLSAGEVDGFGDLLADDLVEHEELPGLAPTKDGVKAFFRMYISAFPDLRMDPQDVLAHEHWGVFDTMTMMQQLGAVPAGPPG